MEITHEKGAGHMGTARQVVTRMLRYFQSERRGKLTRETIDLPDRKKPEAIHNAGQPPLLLAVGVP